MHALQKWFKKPWFPITNQIDLSRLGKLSEEISELQEELSTAQLHLSRLGSITARCIIQGYDQIDPDRLIYNRLRIQNEIADVMTQCKRLIKALELNEEAIEEREEIKTPHMENWERQLDGLEPK